VKGGEGDIIAALSTLLPEAVAGRRDLRGPTLGGESEPFAAPILVVDDDEQTLALLTEVLEPLGQPVIASRSGEEALQRLAGAEFAAIVLDVSIPGMDGFQIAGLIKSHPDCCHVPLIFLTGDISADKMRAGYALGAADYLFKPFEPEVLRSKVAVFIDLARLRNQARILTRRALHDPLTGLPNRILFLDRLELALGRLARDQTSLAVLFLDLDGFKGINDRHGHAVGDQVLVETATRIQRAIRATDTAARFGGDEFLILCEQLTDIKAIEPLLARIKTSVEQPLTLGGQPIAIRASIGSTATGIAESAEALITQADHAMLRGKTTRR